MQLDINTFKNYFRELDGAYSMLFIVMITTKNPLSLGGLTHFVHS